MSLVSLIIVAYKQEAFIGEAVRSALAQTYAPLELILSDDCSPDTTFELMNHEVEQYRGRHKLILNRNDRNLGLAANYSRACALATGDVIVAQAGDDVSLPNRVSVLMAAWARRPGVGLVFSNVEVIDAKGAVLRRHWFDQPADTSRLTPGSFIGGAGPSILGCSSAFSRRLMTEYGHLDPQVTAEDPVLAFRALLDGGIEYVHDILVQYRQHATNLVLGRDFRRRDDRVRTRRAAVGRLAIVREWLRACKRRDYREESITRSLLRRELQCWCDVSGYDSGRIRAFGLAMRALVQGRSLRCAAGIFKRHVLQRN